MTQDDLIKAFVNGATKGKASSMTITGDILLYYDSPSNQRGNIRPQSGAIRLRDNGSIEFMVDKTSYGTRRGISIILEKYARTPVWNVQNFDHEMHKVWISMELSRKMKTVFSSWDSKNGSLDRAYQEFIELREHWYKYRDRFGLSFPYLEKLCVFFDDEEFAAKLLWTKLECMNEIK